MKQKGKIETGFAQVNGTNLYYEVAGSGDPVVLIHGNFGDSRYFDEQFKSFTKGHKTIRYDVRGFGKSAMPVERIRYSDSDDLNALLEFLGISKAHIAGFSMGSGIAVDFVLTYLKRSSSLISIGPWVRGYHSSATEIVSNDFRKIYSKLIESGHKAAADLIINCDCFNPFMIPPDIRKRIREINKDFLFWHFINVSPRLYIDPPAIQQLEKISVPTLLITAEYDILACREIADIMEKTIPNTKRVDIADATHYMFMEKPDKFNKVVLDFLIENKN